MKNILVIYLLCLSLSCCEKPDLCDRNSHNFIIYKNSSTKRIYWSSGDIYSDNSTNFTKIKNNIFLIAANKSHKQGVARCGCYEDILTNGNTNKVFFYDADVLENNPWEDVINKKLGLLKVIEFDLGYLKQNDFVVEYK